MAVGVLFTPMVSGWSGGRAVGQAAGNSLSGLYLRNRNVWKLILCRDIGYRV